MRPTEIMLSVILAFALLAAPLSSDGQQPAKVYRIGLLFSGLPTPATPAQARNREAMIEGLRERGYIEGQNLVIDRRYTEGQDARAPSLAAELVSLKPDLIIADGTAQVRAVQEASSMIPIVMFGVIEPVRRGLVASLAHPGGNVTGLTDTVGVEITGKYLQLLKELVPKISRAAALGYSSSQPDRAIIESEMEAAARALNVTLQFYNVGNPQELEDAFAAITKARPDALLVRLHPFFGNHSKRIADFAAQGRLPAVYPFRVFVDNGGLMCYEASQPALYRRVAYYVDKILKGANPGDLAVEQPTTFELAINLKTAKALGLKVPEPLLIRADEVIE
ncbi:MAG TPA: ABC transporter substrate-binding protein [Syntrophobacteria bacterium]|jgi:putative ABC transport system substrate-binding protein|nr:ABC transporter substrate-binding protein [Syntrophobacteria bacterium]